jgi:hypothetical protein
MMPHFELRWRWKQSRGKRRWLICQSWKVVDNFEKSLRRGKFDKGFIVAFSFTRGAHEEAARLEGKGLEITLISVEDLLCESSFLLCQGSTANVTRNTQFSIEYFFIILSGSFENMRTGSRGSTGTSVR